MNLLEIFKPVRAFVFDMDGVLTDGSLLILPGGEWVRKMDIKDGYALQLAVKSGYHVAVITGSLSKPVEERLNRLGVTDVFQQVSDKVTVLKHWADNKGLKNEEILFMGDDMPDLGALQYAGVGCCPADAAPEIRAVSGYISSKEGGKGSVRDVIEKVLKLHNKWNRDAGLSSI